MFYKQEYYLCVRVPIIVYVDEGFSVNTISNISLKRIMEFSENSLFDNFHKWNSQKIINMFPLSVKIENYELHFR